MKALNLKNQNVEELSTEEMVVNNGGIIGVDDAVAIVVAGFIWDTISDLGAASRSVARGWAAAN